MRNLLICIALFQLLTGCSDQKSDKPITDAGKKTEIVSPEALQCSGYEVSKMAAITAVAEQTFQCSNMIRDGGYSQFNVSTSFKNGACFLNVNVSGIINGNSKTCSVSKEVDKVENNRIMFVKP